jgi:hypothetical protein
LRGELPGLPLLPRLLVVEAFGDLPLCGDLELWRDGFEPSLIRGIGEFLVRLLPRAFDELPLSGDLELWRDGFAPSVTLGIGEFLRLLLRAFGELPLSGDLELWRDGFVPSLTLGIGEFLRLPLGAFAELSRDLKLPLLDDSNRSRFDSPCLSSGEISGSGLSFRPLLLVEAFADAAFCCASSALCSASWCLAWSLARTASSGSERWVVLKFVQSKIRRIDLSTYHCLF